MMHAKPPPGRPSINRCIRTTSAWLCAAARNRFRPASSRWSIFSDKPSRGETTFAATRRPVVSSARNTSP